MVQIEIQSLNHTTSRDSLFNRPEIFPHPSKVYVDSDSFRIIITIIIEHIGKAELRNTF